MKKLIQNKAFLFSLIAVFVVGIGAFLYTRFGRQDVGPSPGVTQQSGQSSQSKTQKGGQNQQSSTLPQDQQSSTDQLSSILAQYQETQPKTRVKSYPVGQWELPVPYINPFGAQENYLSVEYATNQSAEFAFIGRDNLETTSSTCGDVWKMAIAWTDPTMDPFEDLQLYLSSEIGGEVYYSTQFANALVFHATDENGTRWWGNANIGGQGYYMTVYREFRLQAGTPLTIKTADYPNNIVYFMTEHPGDRFQTITAEIPEGEITFRGKGRYMKGGYVRDTVYDKRFSAKKSNKYVLDDIPQESSGSMLWEVSWVPGSMPSEISLTLEYGDNISPVKYGERLGALTVKGVSFGNVRVEPVLGVKISHPEFDINKNLYGDITPEGNTLFSLPSGYWNVIVQPEQGDLLSCKTRLIPVNEGEMTVLEFPPVVNESYRNKGLGAANEQESGITILETAEQGDTASITFLMLDSKDPMLVPDLTNTEITEGGQPGRLVSIERIQTPPSVVLVLDSSGSMRGQMENALASARTFIQGLPENSFIQVIDFDTKAKVLQGTTKDEALKGLDSIKANGATALYDSILVGLDLLKGKQRPTLVIFTDGVDANNDDTGPGSVATKPQVIKAVAESDVTLFAIGFGPNHDNETLLELAGVSDGMYYPAQDKQALDNVFNAINNKLGNTFKAVYQRPKEAATSDIPVISLVLDTSGSMDEDPSVAGCGYRIDKVKNLYHDFINSIPDQSQVQLMRFAYDVTVDQMNTTNRPELLQALGELRAGGGTEILMSTRAAYNAINAVPSNKRVIVYLTDAALNVDDREGYERLLGEIKDQGIRTLWVGLGVEESENVFAWAAEKSGGRYVISEDPEVLRKALDEALAQLQEIPPEKLTLSVTVKAGKTDYTASRLVDFPLPKSSGEKVALNTMKLHTGTKIRQYDKKAAELIYGTSMPGTEVMLTRQIPLNAEEKNKAIILTAKEAYFMKVLKGVQAPSGKCFMAVELEIRNNTAEKIPYLIPDISSHFFATMNNEGSYPTSTATWLAEMPLAMPGETSITIPAGETAKGVLIFLVPDTKTEQFSLNCYDVQYGHIILPLIGNLNTPQVTVEALPTTQTGKLSDTFSLSITGKTDLPKIEQTDAGEYSLFRVIEGNLQSRVQAILDIVPQERFFVKIPTGAGPLMAPMSSTTALLPFGFFRPVTLAPGSENRVRLSFQLPASLKDAKMELYGDLNGGAVTIPLSGNSAYNSAAGKISYEGDGMTMTVNALTRIKQIEGLHKTMVVADITITDKADGLGTTGFTNTFTLIRDGYNATEAEQPIVGSVGLGNFTSGGTNDKVLAPDPLTDQLLFGINNSFNVYDGESRRGFVVFTLPNNLYNEAWTLQSPYFPDLKQSLAAGTYTEGSFKDQGLLVTQKSPKIDETFNRNLTVALTKVISDYQSLKALNPPANAVQKVGIDAGGLQKNTVPVPVATLEGSTLLKSVSTMEDFQKLMNSLKWLPSKDASASYYRNSPEAVLTQGWGTEGDLANVAGKLLAKLGYKLSPKVINVTDKGREALKKLAGVDNINLNTLAGWAYTDEQGNPKVFVVPFMRDLSELTGLAYHSGSSFITSPVMGRIRVAFNIVANQGSAATSMSNISNVLGGSTGDEAGTVEIQVLSADISLPELGKDAVDIRFSGKDKLITALLQTEAQVYLGDQYIDTSKCQVKSIKISVKLPEGEFVHETVLGEGDDITGVFHTVGINLPDITEEAANTLQKAADNAYKAAQKPDEISTLRWYTRNIINKFVVTQTKFENQLAKDLEVTVGRTDKPRCIAVTIRKKDGSSPLLTSIDLMQALNQTHSGIDEAVHAFNIISGLYASRLEGEVLPGDRMSFVELWQNSPEDTQFFLSSMTTRNEDLRHMKDQGYPDFLIKRAQTNNKAMLLPNKPTTVNGAERWAWLEINEKTFETIAVLDTGEHGSFAEFLMTLDPVVPNGEDLREFAIGAFMGIDTSIWSVASFSLALDDPEAILEAAKAYTYIICESVDSFMMGVGLSKLEYGVGKAKIKIQENPDFDYMAKYFQKLESDYKPSGGQNYMGLSDGFKAAAAYYFQKAQGALEED